MFPPWVRHAQPWRWLYDGGASSVRCAVSSGWDMAVQEVTLRLPVEILQQIERAAAHAHRPVDDVLVEAVIAAAPTAGTLTNDAQSALAQMAYLNDAALWQAARASMSADQRQRLEDLH